MDTFNPFNDSIKEFVQSIKYKVCIFHRVSSYKNEIYNTYYSPNFISPYINSLKPKQDCISLGEFRNIETIEFDYFKFFKMMEYFISNDNFENNSNVIKCKELYNLPYTFTISNYSKGFYTINIKNNNDICWFISVNMQSLKINKCYVNRFLVHPYVINLISQQYFNEYKIKPIFLKETKTSNDTIDVILSYL